MFPEHDGLPDQFGHGAKDVALLTFFHLIEVHPLESKGELAYVVEGDQQVIDGDFRSGVYDEMALERS